MPRETKQAKIDRAVEVCRRLDEKYGPVECFLDHENPFRLTIAVLLSAQTTDAQVNKVTPALFERFPTPEAMAAASPEEVAEHIHSLGFYKSKARHCVECAQMIVSEFGGEVPHTMEELTRLPGVGRKTANIVMNVGFGIVEGIAVDTHVNRIAPARTLAQEAREGAAQDRAGPATPFAARALGSGEPPVDQARSRHVRGARPQVRRLRPRGHLPQRPPLLVCEHTRWTRGSGRLRSPGRRRPPRACRHRRCGRPPRRRRGPCRSRSPRYG